MHPRLRTRVAAAFGLLSLGVAIAGSLVTYGLVSSYLLDQRERGAIERTVLDADFLASQSVEGTDSVAEALERLPAAQGVQRLLRSNDVWFSSGVTISPDDLPADLLTGQEQGAVQRFTIGSGLYLGVSIPIEQAPIEDALFVEVVPLTGLVSTLDGVRSSLIAATVLATLLGAAVGWYAAGRLLRPLRRMAATADGLAAGDLQRRMASENDADLDGLTAAFNGMAESVESRIARERRFVANVGHELRTPVTVTLGTAELLESRRSHLRPQDAELLDLLGEQVGHLAKTVLDLLELGTLTPDTVPDLEPVDVAEVVTSVARMSGVDPALVTVTGRPVVSTDPRRLERILANLLDNAERHGGGATAISLRDGDAESGCVIVVEDGGPGIPVEERESVFELFSRGSGAPEGGTGLGLAIAAEQAELIGARISVADATHGGAAFTITLPADAGADLTSTDLA